MTVHLKDEGALFQCLNRLCGFCDRHGGMPPKVKGNEFQCLNRLCDFLRLATSLRSVAGQNAKRRRRRILQMS